MKAEKCGHEHVGSRYAGYCTDDCYHLTWRNSPKGKASLRKYRTSLKGRFANAQGQAKKRKITWNLTLEQYADALRLGFCTYCRGSLPSVGVGLDRIHNALGYEVGNVLPCCESCNSIRGDKLSVSQMHRVTQALAAPVAHAPFRVYLAGTITTEDDYFQRWRVEASHYLKEKGVTPLSPMAQKEVNSSVDGGITSNIPNEDIFMRDYCMVRSANLILANLKLVGDSGVAVKKPLIGTYFEMAWAWQMNKPIVAVVENGNYLFNHHPFLAATITHKFETLEEALNNICTYWFWMRQDEIDHG